MKILEHLKKMFETFHDNKSFTGTIKYLTFITGKCQFTEENADFSPLTKNKNGGRRWKIVDEKVKFSREKQPQSGLKLHQGRALSSRNNVTSF